MNRKIRELLDRKKEENRLLEEKKLENNKNSKKTELKPFKTYEKEKVVKNVIKKIEKEKIINNEEDKIIQKDYEKLKKQSEITEKFIKLANKLDIDDIKFPKTEKGMSTKAKEILEKLTKKIEKEEKKK